MKLSEILNQDHISLDIKAAKKEDVLREMVKLLGLSSAAQRNLATTLAAREDLGSTGVGNGIAIPHCRSLVVGELMVAIGRSKAGVSFQSMDGKRANLFFLIVAPPSGDPSEYLIALGKVAQVAGRLAKDKRLKVVKQRKQLMDIIKELEE
jgi:mannitol/fructose-specific phosphotransferase system IIA component (Ntr-type)